MQKDFDTWNTAKKKIHTSRAPFAHAREIWWCSLGVNVGFEQDWTGSNYDRPAAILKSLSRETCLVIPLTTSAHAHPLRLSVGIVEGKEARAVLSQMRVVDTKRLVRKVGVLEKGVFEIMRNAVKAML